MSVFVMAGGGTGGHIIPALAVARELKNRGHEPVFIGTASGMEARLVPDAGFPIEWIRIGGLNRVGLIKRIQSALQLPVSIVVASRILGRLRPAAIFSMGGYVSGPVMIAAALRRLPIVLMEPNAVPGLANRWMAPWVRMALVNFPVTERYFRGRAELTGVPVRAEFFNIAPRPLQFPLTLLITGGSQGSGTLNRAAMASWPLFRNSGLALRILHQAGRAAYQSIQKEFASASLEGEVVAFISDMPAAFASADLIVSRSGASTVSELAASGKPSILVPFPFAADDHQLRNAEAMAESGAARMIPDKEMTGERLFSEVYSLLTHTDELSRMAGNARAMAKHGAAVRAADILESFGHN